MVWLLSVCPVTVQTHMWKNRRSVCCAWLSLVAAAADVGKWCRENPAWLIDTASGNVAVCMKTDTDLFRKNCSKLGYLWRRKLNNSWMSVYLTSVLFFSHPQSEVWPHDRRTFPIYLCPLSFWLTLSRWVLSTYWCCPFRPCVVFFACVHLALFLALSLSPGNSLVCSWCDHSMLACLLWPCPASRESGS